MAPYQAAFLFFVPRRKAQSTSGRSDSARTTPLDSRSKLMQSDSPIFCFAETALRMYPTDVPQREAKSCCAATSSELR